MYMNVKNNVCMKSYPGGYGFNTMCVKRSDEDSPR